MHNTTNIHSLQYFAMNEYIVPKLYFFFCNSQNYFLHLLELHLLIRFIIWVVWFISLFGLCKCAYISSHYANLKCCFFIEILSPFFSSHEFSFSNCNPKYIYCIKHRCIKRQRWTNYPMRLSSQFFHQRNKNFSFTYITLHAYKLLKLTKILISFRISSNLILSFGHQILFKGMKIKIWM